MKFGYWGTATFFFASWQVYLFRVIQGSAESLSRKIWGLLPFLSPNKRSQTLISVILQCFICQRLEEH